MVNGIGRETCLERYMGSRLHQRKLKLFYMKTGLGVSEARSRAEEEG